MTTGNEPVDIANQIISGLADALTGALEASAVAAAPFLGAPVISNIFQAICSWIEENIVQFLSQSLDYVIIKLEVAMEASGYNSWVRQLVAAIQSGDLNALKTAQAGVEAAGHTLGHWDSGISS